MDIKIGKTFPLKNQIGTFPFETSPQVSLDYQDSKAARLQDKKVASLRGGKVGPALSTHCSLITGQRGI